MAKTKIEYLNAVELKVKDVAGEFIKIAVVSGISFDAEKNITAFTVDTLSGFNAGDYVFISDGVTSKFLNILSVEKKTVEDEVLLLISVSGDYHAINPGAVIKKSDAINHIDEALMVYSKIKPLVKAYEITGDNSNSYNLPESWIDGLSEILSLEYPEGFNPKNILEENNYEVYLGNDNKYKIKFVFDIGTGNKALVNYSTLYSFSSDNPPKSSAPDIDFYAICNIASYYYLMGLASSSSHNVSSLIDADRVNKDSKTDAFRRLAKEYLGQAASWLGVSIKSLDGSEITPGAASSSQDVEYGDERISIFGKKRTALGTGILRNRIF